MDFIEYNTPMEKELSFDTQLMFVNDTCVHYEREVEDFADGMPVKYEPAAVCREKCCAQYRCRLCGQIIEKRAVLFPQFTFFGRAVPMCEAEWIKCQNSKKTRKKNSSGKSSALMVLR